MWYDLFGEAWPLDDTPPSEAPPATQKRTAGKCAQEDQEEGVVITASPKSRRGRPKTEDTWR